VEVMLLAKEKKENDDAIQSPIEAEAHDRIISHFLFLFLYRSLPQDYIFFNRK